MPLFWMVVALVFVKPLYTRAEIIPHTNRTDWVVGWTVGPQISKPTRTTMHNVVTGFGADPTGVVDSYTNIQAAIATAASNEIVYFPNGIYKATQTISVDKHGLTARGESSNSVLHVAGNQSVGFAIGHQPVSASQASYHLVASGATKGSSNIALFTVTDSFAQPMAVGDAFEIHMTVEGSEAWPYISTYGHSNMLKEVVVVHALSGTNVTLTKPLNFNWTNNAVLRSLHRFGAVRSSENMRIGISFENLTITTTNNGVAGTGGTLMTVGMVRNCWFSNVTLLYGNNFWMDIDGVANIAIERCELGRAFSAGPNHSGIRISRGNGVLIQDNIFHNGLFPAIEANEGFTGSAIVFNFGTNIYAGQMYSHHNPHPLMNLYEGGVTPGCFYISDGYFGSTSHDTLFRNALRIIVYKRWTTHNSAVGNVIGYHYDPEYVSYGDLISIGQPNIGNGSWILTNPPVPWNWPGAIFSYAGNYRSNGIFVLTNTTTGITIPGNFTNLVTFAQDPNHPIVFQDAVNTNKYWWPAGQPLYATNITTSNMTVNHSVTVSNGWRVFSAGAPSWQQLQLADATNNLFHGNLLYTNEAGTVVWDPTIADHDIADSILYPNGAPAWWTIAGTNAVWPAVDPERSGKVAMIPAEARYLGLETGGGGTPPPEDERPPWASTVMGPGVFRGGNR
jgi:hypothetical protein